VHTRVPCPRLLAEVGARGRDPAAKLGNRGGFRLRPKTLTVLLGTHR